MLKQATSALIAEFFQSVRLPVPVKKPRVQKVYKERIHRTSTRTTAVDGIRLVNRARREGGLRPLVLEDIQLKHWEKK